MHKYKNFNNLKLDQSFPLFLIKSFNTVSPGIPYLHNWHIDLIADKLKQIEEGKISRLIINIPPRYLKSICVSVAWPAWLLARNPSTRIMTASYSQTLSNKHSQDCRLIMMSDWYKELFPHTQIAKGENQKFKFVTTQRGFRFATSTGGTATGEGGDILIVDDPQNPNKINSKKYREATIEWFEQTFISRLNSKKKGAIVLIMQRLHEDDLCGYLLKNKRQQWNLLKLPALCEKPISFYYNEIIPNVDCSIFNNFAEAVDPKQTNNQEIIITPTSFENFEDNTTQYPRTALRSARNGELSAEELETSILYTEETQASTTLSSFAEGTQASTTPSSSLARAIRPETGDLVKNKTQDPQTELRYTWNEKRSVYVDSKNYAIIPRKVEIALNSPLHEAREAYKDLQNLRISMGDYNFTAQYLQSPVPNQGSMIKKIWLKYFSSTKEIEFSQIIQSWDTAIKAKNEHDYSVGITIGIHNNNYYILDILQIKAEFPELILRLKNYANQWKPQAILVEDAASGQSLIQTLGSNFRTPIIPIKPKFDKITRFAKHSILFESGRIFIDRHADWRMSFEAELLTFPKASHDDQVDSLSQALNYLEERRNTQLKKI